MIWKRIRGGIKLVFSSSSILHHVSSNTYTPRYTIKVSISLHIQQIHYQPVINTPSMPSPTPPSIHPSKELHLHHLIDLSNGNRVNVKRRVCIQKSPPAVNAMPALAMLFSSKEKVLAFRRQSAVMSRICLLWENK